MCAWAHTHIYIHTYTHTHTGMGAHTHTHTHTHVCIHVCAYIQLSVTHNQKAIDRWMKGCVPLFPKKGDFRLAKNYQGITLTSIAAKIYNALLHNHREPKTYLGRTKMASGRIDPRHHRFSIEFLKVYTQKT